MREMAKTELGVVSMFLLIGLTMIITNLIPVIFIAIGYTLVVMVVVFLVLDNGPRMWYWWVSFRWGWYVTLSYKTWYDHEDEINEWLKDNIRFKFMHVNNDEVYFFLRNTDAIGFKLRWV